MVVWPYGEAHGLNHAGSVRFWMLPFKTAIKWVSAKTNFDLGIK
ncbi:hypothetical protein SAMN02910315_00851 [Methanobrevibacter millerae]|uniref:Uncharacterized protein n=1 Tax=Methanobrevibacter millerae TaxID=230361 RepID=A0A1G5VU99_9EURY|nr:hypothetical protein SAMN02910315_00851 [Methanobrevibacter millerae]